MDIGPAFPEKNIPVAFAADDNYLPYVAVAINSLVAKTASSNLDVLVLHDGISEIAKAGFFTGVRKDERLSVRFVDIGDTVRGTAARSFVQKNYLSVTALFRLFIPKVLTAYERLVYLDVDLVVCKDISELYSTDLAGCLFGAVRDYGVKDVVRKNPKYRELAEKYGFSEWDEYVNSGVLLMDLAALRSADLLGRLLPIAVEAAGFCCDQDALNFICKGRIFHLDPKWNILMFPSSYAGQLMAAGGQLGIAHFAGRMFKPWNRPWPMHVHLWWSNVEDHGFAVAQWRRVFGVRGDAVDCGEGIAVTVIVPVYNSERHLFEALVSLLVQPLRNIEVICVDDGSTDASCIIVQTLQKLDSRVKLLSQRRQGPGVARNVGLDVATGEYIFFLDSDDRIAPGDALLRACEQAKRDGLDMLLAASSTIAEDGQILRTAIRLNRELVPRESVFAPDALGWALFLCTSPGPCGKLYRRSFLEENNLRFPALKRSEDFPMVCLAQALSSRIGVFTQSIFERRIGVASSLESTKDETPLIFFEAEQLLRDSLQKRNLWSRFKAAVYSSFVSHLAYNLRAVRQYPSFRAIIAKYRQDPRRWICWEHVVVPEGFAGQVQLVKDIMEDMNEDDQIALFVKLREAAAKNAPEVASTIAKLREANAKQVKQIATLREASATQVKQVATLHEANAGQAKQIATLREANAGQVKQIATLREANAGQAKQIATLHEANAGQAKQIATLHEASAEQAKQIATLREANAGQVKQIATLREASAGQVKQIATLREAVAVQVNQISSLKCRLDRCQKEISELHKSQAYRTGMAITWPARKVWGGIKCLRENGIKYTAKHFVGKVARSFGCNAAERW